MRTIVILFSVLCAFCACAQQPAKIENSTIIEKAISLRGDKEYVQAYKLLKPLADQGDLNAIYRLAELHDLNTSLISRLKQNPYYSPQKARELFYIAAKQGHDRAQLALGINLRRLMNDHYRDSPEKFRATYKEACEWSEKGAMQGSKMGTYPVARCHKNGGFTGIRDYMLAYAWFAVPGFYQAKKGINEDIDDNFFMNEAAKRVWWG